MQLANSIWGYKPIFSWLIQFVGLPFYFHKWYKKHHIFCQIRRVGWFLHLPPISTLFHNVIYFPLITHSSFLPSKAFLSINQQTPFPCILEKPIFRWWKLHFARGTSCYSWGTPSWVNAEARSSHYGRKQKMGSVSKIDASGRLLGGCRSLEVGDGSVS